MRRKPNFPQQALRAVVVAGEEGKHPWMGSQGPTPGAGPARAGEDRSSAVATSVGAQTQPERTAERFTG